MFLCFGDAKVGLLIDALQNRCAGHLWNIGCVVFTANGTEHHRGKDLGSLKGKKLIVASALSEISKRIQVMCRDGRKRKDVSVPLIGFQVL